MRSHPDRAEPADDYSNLRRSQTSVLVELFHHRDHLTVFIIRRDYETPLVSSTDLKTEELAEIADEFVCALAQGNQLTLNTGWRQLSAIICNTLQILKLSELDIRRGSVGRDRACSCHVLTVI